MNKLKVSNEIFSFLFSVCTTLFFSVDAFAASGLQLGANELVALSGAQCGLVKGKWIPGSILKNGKFYSYSQQKKDVNKQLRKKGLKSATKKRLQSKLKAVSKKIKKQNAICSRVPALLRPTPTPISIATPLPGAQQIAWSADATDVRTNIGGEYLYFCPSNPAGTDTGIYGTDVYTSDSEICLAAVHAGLFNKSSGGNAKIRIKAGQSLYIGSVRNGIESNFYGPYVGSYVFIDLVTGQELISNTPPIIKWSMSAYPVYTLIDQQFTFICPSGGVANSIWGTDIYTYDSSICTAAVHVGLISLQNGGEVTIRIRPGQSSYIASTRHGITSSSYGPWSGSFIFVQ
ncbi:MAG: hypothetical protein GYA55_04050 [SAR324 cluster bacterium]|uniref:LCCL domain-containing protein n=1 Tax=SAR324 cluster bacterium TaxID=2024889 RepID=A0A7X9FQ71_9DELT|nr:hypothetical protein [SAR324 cluster bacterium]